MMMRARSIPAEREGLSLLEVLITLFILGVLIVPIVTLYVSSQRIGHAAGRHVELALHAQSILEALSRLEPAELPLPSPGVEAVLMDDGAPAGKGGGSERYAQVLELFGRAPPAGCQRSVTAQTFASGEIVLRMVVEWDAIVGEARTRQRLSLPMMATPRGRP